MKLLIDFKQKAVTIAFSIALMVLAVILYENLFSIQGKIIREFKTQIHQNEQKISNLKEELSTLNQEEKKRLDEIEKLKTKLTEAEQLIQTGEDLSHVIKEKFLDFHSSVDTIAFYTRRSVSRSRAALSLLDVRADQ